MRPFIQNLEGWNKLAIKLIPPERQGYNAPYQQNTTRERLNYILQSVNTHSIRSSFGGLF